MVVCSVEEKFGGYFKKMNSYNNRLFIAGEVFGGSKIEGAYLSGYHLAKYMNNQY